MKKKTVLMISIYMILMACSSDNRTVSSKASAKIKVECKLPKGLTEALESRTWGFAQDLKEPNPNHVANKHQKELLLEIKKNTNFPILSHAEALCYSGKITELLPTADDIKALQAIMEKYHYAEYNELKTLLLKGTIEKEEFHPDGSLSYFEREIASGRDERIREGIQLDTNGDTVVHTFSGQGFGWPRFEKTGFVLIGSRGRMQTVASINKNQLSYAKAWATFEKDENDPMKCQFAIGTNVIYDSGYIIRGVKLGTATGPRSNMRLYEWQQYDDIGIVLENGALSYTKFLRDKDHKKTTHDFKTGKLVQYYILKGDTLIERDFDLEVRAIQKEDESSDEFGIFIKKRNIDREYYDNGALQWEKDFSDYTTINYSTDGSIESKTKANIERNMGWKNDELYYNQIWSLSVPY